MPDYEYIHHLLYDDPNISTAAAATIAFVLAHQGSGGVSADAWSASIDYSFGSIVSGSDDNVYVSLTGGNLGNDPVTDGGVHWKNGNALFIPMVIPTSGSLDSTRAVVIDSTSMASPASTLELVGEGTSAAGGTASNADIFEATTAPNYDFGFYITNYAAAFLQFTSDASPVVFGLDGPASGPDFSGAFFAVEHQVGPSSGHHIASLKLGGTGLGLLMAGTGAPESGSGWLSRSNAFWFRFDGSPWIYQTSDNGNSWASIL